MAMDPGGLQFDRAEFDNAAAAVSTCELCSRSIHGSYYRANGKTICSSCREAISEGQSAAGAGARLIRASLYGTGAAALGSIVYFAILKLTGIQFGLIAIAVGWMVGKCVSKGSGGRGGWAYQALAVFLTYSSIVATYIPFALEGLKHRPEKSSSTAPATAGAPSTNTPETASPNPAPGSGNAIPSTPRPGPAKLALGLVVLFGLALALPFLMGFKNIMGLVIIAIGLYEAWKLNKKITIEFSGPFQLAARPPQPVTDPAP